ncbi:MAG TPA: HepT-like ribonuclease domain-containing protein [Nitrospira sp.]|nr:HepT-like ribonuclease domain-containing protein [Nitrospira sp.]
MIDRRLITRKMSLILEDLAAMAKLSRLSRAQYLEDSTHETLAERYLERAIGRMIDINFHLITESGHAPPKDYFTRLGTLGVMTADLAKKTAMAAGLRNRIVHEYDDIDPERVYEALPVTIRAIPAYLDHIQRFIEKLPQG